MIGKFVVVRTFSAGVHVGRLASADAEGDGSGDGED